MIRLNLGCGSDIKPGYVNVDFRDNHGVDLIQDLSHFPWAFEDSSADEILMLDFLEHFPYSQTKRILLECYRVLKPNGSLVIQVPDAMILGSVLSGYGRFQCNRCGHWMSGFNEENHDEKCPRCGQSDDDVWDAAMMRMYGGQDYAGNFHYTCFTRHSLMKVAQECGLAGLKTLEDDHQAANWNVKMLFAKGDFW